MLRDLRARISIEGAEEAVSALEQLNAEFDTVSELAEEAAGSIEELGSAAGAIDAASEATGGLSGALSDLIGEFQQVRGVLGGIGLAGMGLVSVATKAAIGLEDVTTRLKVLAGTEWPKIVQTFEKEVERTERRITFGQLAEAFVPVTATLQDAVEVILPYLDEINSALLAGGLSAEKFAMAWTYVAQAIATGNAEILTRPSRLLPFPIIRGQEAIEIARQMRKEYDLLTNARIFAEAVARSESITQEQLNEVFSTTASRLQALGGAWGDFLEEFGAGSSALVGQLTSLVFKPLDYLIRSGTARELGKIFSIFSVLATALGGGAVLAKLAAFIGIGGGTIGSLLAVVLPWVGVIFAAAVMINDVINVLTGGKSILLEGFKSLFYWLKQAFYAWDRLVQRYIVSPTVSAFEYLKNVILDWAQRVAEFFGVETERVKSERGKEFAEEALAQALVQALAPEAQLVAGPAGEIDWVKTAAQAFGDEWKRIALENEEVVQAAREAIEKFVPEEYRQEALAAFEQMLQEMRRATEAAAPVEEAPAVPPETAGGPVEEKPALEEGVAAPVEEKPAITEEEAGAAVKEPGKLDLGALPRLFVDPVGFLVDLLKQSVGGESVDLGDLFKELIGAAEGFLQTLGIGAESLKGFSEKVDEAGVAAEKEADALAKQQKETFDLKTWLGEILSSGVGLEEVLPELRLDSIGHVVRKLLGLGEAADQASTDVAGVAEKTSITLGGFAESAKQAAVGIDLAGEAGLGFTADLGGANVGALELSQSFATAGAEVSEAAKELAQEVGTGGRSVWDVVKDALGGVAPGLLESLSGLLGGLDLNEIVKRMLHGFGVAVEEKPAVTEEEVGIDILKESVGSEAGSLDELFSGLTDGVQGFLQTLGISTETLKGFVKQADEARKATEAAGGDLTKAAVGAFAGKGNLGEAVSRALSGDIAGAVERVLGGDVGGLAEAISGLLSGERDLGQLVSGLLGGEGGDLLGAIAGLLGGEGGDLVGAIAGALIGESGDLLGAIAGPLGGDLGGLLGGAVSGLSGINIGELGEAVGELLSGEADIWTLAKGVLSVIPGASMFAGAVDLLKGLFGGSGGEGGGGKGGGFNLDQLVPLVQGLLSEDTFGQLLGIVNEGPAWRPLEITPVPLPGMPGMPGGPPVPWLRQLGEELGVGPVAPPTEVSGAPSTQVEITFETGAIQVHVGGGMVDEATRRYVIDRTLEELEQQLRAVLEERVR